MGGRGSSSSLRSGTATMGGAPNGPAPVFNPVQNSVTNQAPDASNTPVVPGAVTALTNMSDDQLAALYRASRSADMPNHLNDVADKTQRFVFQAGVNELPTVLDDAAFNQFMQDNNMTTRDILSRSTGGANYTVNGVTVRLTPQQVTDLMKTGIYNYVGGKHGGQLYGAGTYFAKTGGRPTGYGSNGATALAVLNPKTARAIDRSTLISKATTWARSHPKFAAAVGSPSDRSNYSIYALAMGYNVITDHATSPDYHNVIDRSALVYRKSNY